MVGKLVNILVPCIGRVAERNCNNFLVNLSIVYHFQNTDRIATHKYKRVYFLLTKHQHIKRVTVICIGTGNKPVVCRIVSGGIENPVKDNHTGFLVKLVLVSSALADFNNAKEVVFLDSFRVYIVPYIKHKIKPF